jgi:hypothetical protein
MKRILCILLFAAAAFAQEKKEPDYNTNKSFRNKVFTITHRDPNTIAAAVKLLGSGFQGADLNINSALGTLTVRDFPENIVAIEEAIQRLDRPAPPEPDLELQISVLLGSKSALPGAAVPEELGGVVKQLRSTLSYAHYGLLTTTVHRTKTGVGIEGSGVAESTLLGVKAVDGRPILYTYALRSIRGGDAKVDIGNFNFSMRVPLDMGNGGIQYQPVGFETPVSLKQGEKVVIGTTTMNDKALVVVVTAKVE